MSKLYNNTIIIKGACKNLNEFMEKAEGFSPWSNKWSIFEFNQLVPIPLTIINKRNDKEYTRFNEGVAWELENWGCMGGSQNPVLFYRKREELSYIFITYEKIALAFFNTLSTLYPNLNFILNYRIRSDFIEGIVTFKNGTAIRTEYEVDDAGKRIA